MTTMTYHCADYALFWYHQTSHGEIQKRERVNSGSKSRKRRILAGRSSVRGGFEGVRRNRKRCFIQPTSLLILASLMLFHCSDDTKTCSEWANKIENDCCGSSLECFIDKTDVISLCQETAEKCHGVNNVECIGENEGDLCQAGCWCADGSGEDSDVDSGIDSNSDSEAVTGS